MAKSVIQYLFDQGQRKKKAISDSVSSVVGELAYGG